MEYLDKVGFLLVGFSRSMLSMLIIYLVYLVLGSLIFVHLETAEEVKSQAHTMEVTEKAKGMVNFLRANFSDNEIFYAFLREHEKREEKPKLNSLKWSQIFGDKVFFAFTLISTVGFGNVSPNSMLGQIAIVIYSMFGLPLHIAMMRLLSFKYRGGIRAVLTGTQHFFPTYKWTLFIAGSLFFLVWLAIFLFLPAYVFMFSDNWPYFRGVYFSFVTLSTIGLGDYVAGVSPEHIENSVYPYALFLMVVWMFFGLGFVSMALNMLSYVLGIYTLDKLDCKCKERAEARKRFQTLLELITELNWQLVKHTPDNFHSWSEIEELKALITENPHDVTPAMLKRMFDISIDLKEKCYDKLSAMQQTSIPVTPIIQRVKDDLPHILSRESMSVSYSSEAQPQPQPSRDRRHSSIEMVIKRGESSKSLAEFMEQKKSSTETESSQSEETAPPKTADENGSRDKGESSASKTAEDGSRAKSESSESRGAEDDSRAKSESSESKGAEDDSKPKSESRASKASEDGSGSKSESSTSKDSETVQPRDQSAVDKTDDDREVKK